MTVEHLLVIKFLGPCVGWGSTREAKPAGDIHEEISYKELACSVVGGWQGKSEAESLLYQGSLSSPLKAFQPLNQVHPDYPG